MERLSTTPFGQRQVTAGLLATLDLIEDSPKIPHVDKWELFRQLTTAREAYGITDRDLTVLNALLSFHPSKVLGDNAGLIVFPSNKALGQRCHGMAESTLRRHLAALVRAGLVLRHDSANGKRYAVKDRAGDITRAFGFDLRPLLVQSAEISARATEAEARADRLSRLREEASVTKRDAQKLAAYALETGYDGPWEDLLQSLWDLHRMLRRRLCEETLQSCLDTARALLLQVRGFICETKEMSGNDQQNERQFQNSNTDCSDLEPAKKLAEAAGAEHTPDTIASDPPDPLTIPVPLILKAIPDVADYAGAPLQSLRDLTGVSDLLRSVLGISPSAWESAVRVMGHETAAVVLGCILQKAEDIRSPGGYLRALTAKAEAGAFTVGPMVMALIQTTRSKS